MTLGEQTCSRASRTFKGIHPLEPRAVAAAAKKYGNNLIRF